MKSEETSSVNAQFHALGVILLLEMPSSIRFHVDNIEWKAGSQFKGVKMLPLGIHVIKWSLQDQNHAFTSCRFFSFGGKSWQSKLEYFMELKGQQGQGYRSGVRQYHFDSYLAPYPANNIAFWQQNTKYISNEVLDKLQPIDRMQKWEQQWKDKDKKGQEEIEELGIEEGEQIIEQEQGDIHEQTQEEEQVKQSESAGNKKDGKFMPASDTVYYSLIPRHQTIDLTKSALDRTSLIISILYKEHQSNYKLFLGEMQYAFVHFLVGEGKEGWEQWMKMIDGVIMAEGIFVQNSQIIDQKKEKTTKKELHEFGMQFIAVLYDHLCQFPVDFFQDELTKESFLINCLSRLQDYVNDPAVVPKIKKRLIKLLGMLQQKFNYVPLAESDRQDEMPLIVTQNQSYF